MYTYRYTYIYICVYAYICIYVYIFVYMYMYVYMYIAHEHIITRHGTDPSGHCYLDIVSIRHTVLRPREIIMMISLLETCPYQSLSKIFASNAGGSAVAKKTFDLFRTHMNSPRTDIYIYIYGYMYIYINICIHMYLCMLIYTYVRKHMHIFLYIYIHTYTCFYK